MSSPRADRGQKKTKNVQVSRPLLELRDGHVVVVLQNWSLKLRSSHNLLIMLRRASPSAFLPKTEASSARSHESPDTSCSGVAVGPCHLGGSFSSSHWCSSR